MEQSATTSNLLIDADQAQLFLKFLDPDATFFSFQTFDDNADRKDTQLVRLLHGSLEQHLPTLTDLNRRGAGIYVTINETDGKARKAENIVRVRHVFVDLDGAPLDPLLRHLCPPAMVVATSEGKWHAYWPVEGLELNEFRPAQKALIERFGSDRSVKDLPRVMRLPGFYHRKGTPRQVRIFKQWDLAPYPAHQFRAAPLPQSSQREQATADAADTSEAANYLDNECKKVASTSSTSKNRNNTLNVAAYTLGGLVGAGLLEEAIVKERLLVAADECGLARREAGTTIESGLEAGKKEPWSPGLILDPQDPMQTARTLVQRRVTQQAGSVRTLHRHRSSFWSWDGSHYLLKTAEDVRSFVYRFAERARVMTKEGPTPFKPNRDKVGNIVDALAACTHLSDGIDAPAWLDESCDLPPPSEFLAVKNGLLHLPSRELYPPDPTFFNTAASGVTYYPDAPVAGQWSAFLEQIFGGDHEANAALQEFMGYALSTDTSLQKILLLVGPPRAGKGTIARVLRALVGEASVAGPTMSSLGGEFGLEPLIPKTLAIISDARIGARTDKAAVTERLLAISGEDSLSINRKQMAFWHGKLQVRFIIITNELPALSDGSSALANRFLIVMLGQSFLGKEDSGLFEKLRAELPGILNWTLDGYDRLRKRGHFVQPSSSVEALNEIIQLGSPVHAFIADRCDLIAGHEVHVDYLWDEWKTWSSRSGNNTGSRNWFGRNLRSAVPGLRIVDRYPRGTREQYYVGIEVRSEGSAPGLSDREIPF